MKKLLFRPEIMDVFRGLSIEILTVFRITETTAVDAEWLKKTFCEIVDKLLNQSETSQSN